MPGLHDGHRQRLKARFLREGLDGFEPHNALELLLFYAVPQKDTNELAHRLLRRFGSFSGVLDADLDELCAETGVGPSVGTYLKLLAASARYYEVDRAAAPKTLRSIEEIGEFLRPRFLGRKKEMVFLLCLDNRGGMTYGDFVAEGTIDSAPMYVREILERAVKSKAASVVLAHNHPKGLALPSPADLNVTGQLLEALELAKIKLIDHFIFAEDDWVSLRDSGYF